MGGGEEKSKAHQIDYKVLSVQELETRQQTDADNVASILAIQVRPLRLYVT